MSPFNEIALKIIKEQELIIGPVAWQEAGKVPGLNVNAKAHTLSIDESDERTVIDELVGQYEHFFGRAAREVCKEAASSLLADLPVAEIPSSLV